VHEAGSEGFFGRHEPGGEDQLLEARRPEQIDVARTGLHRQAVAEGARDRRAEAGIRRAMRMSAPAAMPKPPPTA
jgi:hypothetical protein